MFLIALGPSPGIFWTACHVYRSPDLLDAVRSSSADEGSDDYLSLCIKETLRMYAPVPIMLSRVVTEQSVTVEADQERLCLRKGDIVIRPTVILQNLSEGWEDAQSYWPSRFSQQASPPAMQRKSSVDLDVGTSKSLHRQRRSIAHKTEAEVKAASDEHAARAHIFPLYGKTGLEPQT